MRGLLSYAAAFGRGMSFWLTFATAQVGSGLRVGLALARRALFGPTLPTWNLLFEVMVSMMRGSFVKDYLVTRKLIDSDISWLPIFPSGVDIVRGQCLGSNSREKQRHSQSPFEWIYRTSDMHMGMGPWDPAKGSMTPALANKKLLLYFHGGAFVYGTR